MAAAARPGPSDARVPCPLCGGLIHPIAGRCKHCKADLTSHHQARPAASAPLPALHGTRNGHAPLAVTTPTAASAMPVSPPRAQPAPVLPPRPPAVPHAPDGSAWRSWPAVVISVAVLAILAAIVLMVWPVARGERPERKSTLPPPPAPERMQTEPDVRQPAPAPAPKPPAAAPAAPDPAPPARPADPAGSNANLDDGAHDVAPMPNPLTPQALPPSLHGLVPGDPSDDKMLELQRIGQILGHVCRKMLRCGGVDDDTKDLCDAMVNADPPRPCPSADRCFARIDAMACGKPLFQLRQLDALLTQFPDCAAATRC